LRQFYVATGLPASGVLTPWRLARTCLKLIGKWRLTRKIKIRIESSAAKVIRADRAAAASNPAAVNGGAKAARPVVEIRVAIKAEKLKHSRSGTTASLALLACSASAPLLGISSNHSGPPRESD